MKLFRNFGAFVAVVMSVAFVGCSGGESPGGTTTTAQTTTNSTTSTESSPAPAAVPTKTTPPGEVIEVRVANSIYAGWMPGYFAASEGVFEKWGNAYGVKIKFIPMDYVPSVEAYVAQKADACFMTNMEALNMPAIAGVDSTVLIVGDYSNGNDKVLARDGLTLKTIQGSNLVELTVSQYLLARGLEGVGRSEKDIVIQNVSDSDIASTFLADKSQKCVTTWNPMAMKIAQEAGVQVIYDSSAIPGEIQDLLVINTEFLKKYPQAAMALTGAWYEVLGLMSRRGAEADAAMEVMAKAAGCSLVEYKAQLKTTAMFYTPDAAVAFAEGAENKAAMEKVRQFSFTHGMMGPSAISADVVGIQYPDGTVQGNASKVKLRYTSEYMKKAASGEISLTK